VKRLEAALLAPGGREPLASGISLAEVFGVPPHGILSGAALDLLAAGGAIDHVSLARVPGIGPRTLAKFGDELVRLLTKVQNDR